MKKTLFSIIAIWLILVSLSFAWNYFNAVKNHQHLAQQTARATFQQIFLAGAWNIGHEKVYVYRSDKSEAGLQTGKGNHHGSDEKIPGLTLINPAEMFRQLSNIAENQQGIQFHLVGQALNSQTNSWDAEAIKAIKNGQKDVGEFSRESNRVFYQHMSPLFAEKSCLKCHSKQGFREGDLLGGMSIKIPFAPVFSILPMASAHFGAGLFGTLLMIWLGFKLNSAYETIRRQAKIDELTGIPNRRFFSERLKNEFNRCHRENQPLSLIMCDLDHFKDYNDTYGHSAGDKCLKEVAQTIEKTLRRSFDFCARYGGEEIVVILPGTPQEGALNVAERLRANIEGLNIPHKNSPTSPFVTASMGVATDYLDYDSYEELIKNADRALYRGKANGRNRVEVFLLGEKIHSLLKTAFSHRNIS
jgi:diguanylate cyclase (GGDEF)-like protein